jgi:hypothetical protein
VQRLVVLATLATAGCIDYLDSGELGPARYFGEIRGDRPLPLFPPMSDRDGNLYVLSGVGNLRPVNVFTGHAGGGWSSGCGLHKADDRGTHGWVGRAQSKAWYWSGDALVEVDGETGSCTYVLDRDPASAASIAFLGVVPHVREAPSRTSTVALLQSVGDLVPYFAVIDLGQRRYTELHRFEPADATAVKVLGTGAIGENGEGVMLLRYEQGAAVRVEARFLRADGTVDSIAEVSGLVDAPEDAIAGGLQVSDDGVVAGLVLGGQLVTFTRSGGGTRPVTELTPVGVHRSVGQLWLVGLQSGGPALASIPADGSPTPVTAWTASETARAALGTTLQVLDDRAPPRRYVTWPSPTSAIGDFPFLSAQSPHQYALDTTAWLIAGPSYSAAGETRTSVAVAPMGISYP